MSAGFGEWNLPFEQVDRRDVDIDGLVVDSVDVTGGVMETPLGTLPVLVLAFRSSSVPLEQQLPRLMFIGPATVLTAAAALISDAAAAATRAAAADGGGN